MRLALIGVDDQTLTLARAAHAQGHTIVASTDPERLGELGADARMVYDWESLISAPDVDGILVARDDDEELHAERLRKLIQSETPLLVSHPTGVSMLVCYELEMIRSELGGVVMPNLPARAASVVDVLRQLVQQSSDEYEFGPVEQVLFERATATQEQTEILRHFARDVDLIRATCGEVHRLGAMSAGQESLQYSTLGVQMSTADGPLVRWNVVPVDQAPGGRLTLISRTSRVVLDMPDDAEAWRLTLRTEQGDETIDYPTAAIPETILETFERAIGGEPVDIEWSDAAKAIDLTETISRSLAKGRTLELHDEEFSEASTFKGTMTSVGCGLLLLGLAILGGVAVALRLAAAAQLHGLVQILALWPYLLLSLFVVFLMLQVFLKFARRS